MATAGSGDGSGGIRDGLQLDDSTTRDTRGVDRTSRSGDRGGTNGDSRGGSDNGASRGSTILGDLEKTIASAASPRDRLIAAAELYHAYSFDRVSECDERLDYEPRCSASCADRGCKTIWAGSKAGEIFRLGFTSKDLVTRRVSLPRGVRALVHVHRRAQLVVGLDSGHLVVLDARNLTIERRFYLGRLREDSQPQEFEYDHDFVYDDSVESRFKFGITAILELPAINPRFVDIVVATRSPELLVVRLHDQSIKFRGRRPLPGWTRCLAIAGLQSELQRGEARELDVHQPIGGEPPRDQVEQPGEMLVGATRGGEFLEWQCQLLLAEPPVLAEWRHTETSLLPTTVVRSSQGYAGYNALLIGASDGLHIRLGNERPVHVAVTSSAVLSIATMTIPHREGEKTYSVLGLEDGCLRVIDEDALFDSLAGRDVRQAHDFTIDLGTAALSIEILPTSEPTSRFVFTALRDHNLLLFHVRRREALGEQLDDLWRQVVPEPSEFSTSALEDFLEHEEQLYEDLSSNRENALRYLLVDRIFPLWARNLPASNRRLVQRTCEIAKEADAKVLYRLSATMGDIAGHDAEELIQLSMACLLAMPEGDTRRWEAFVSYHLKQFHACARPLGKREDKRHDFHKLQHWARFVRKYLLLGKTFADKHFHLKKLVERNKQTRKFLDALIYAARLERRRYDLEWSRVVLGKDDRVQEIARVELLDDVAIAITASADVLFFDDLDGRPLPIVGGDDRYRLAPLGKGPGLIRTRAARVVRKKDSSVRIALSWTGQSYLNARELQITIFDLELPPPRQPIESVSDASVTSGDIEESHPGRERCVTLRDAHVATCDDTMPFEVYGVVGLEGADAFLVGLDSIESPLALLKLHSADGRAQWKLSLLRLPPPDTLSNAPRAHLSTPVRAVAVIRQSKEGRYLAGAGADDGTLRFIEFDLYGNIIAVNHEPTSLVYPINDIAFAIRPKDEEFRYVCYAGTENGVSLCLLLHLEPDADLTAEAYAEAAAQRAMAPTVSDSLHQQEKSKDPKGRKIKTIFTKQLWRDLHSSSVIAVRTTKIPETDKERDESLYETNVVFVATQAGQVSIYYAKEGNFLDKRITAGSFNYYFEGMRFDRIDLRPGLISWASPRKRSKFLAAYPNGELCFGRFVAPRESRTRLRRKTEIDELYSQVMAAKVFFGHKANEPKKLDICAMIRTGGGALRSYVLRKRLECIVWDKLTEVGLAELFDKYLEGLSPDVVEERDLIKVVVDMVSRQILDQDPKTLLADLRPETLRLGRNLVRPACERLTRYLVHNAVQSRPGPVRVRMVIMTALFRANVFRHIANCTTADAWAITLALQQVLTLCLRDDNRIVRVESLRAVGVALRNISVLLTEAGDAHRELRESFFPDGLKTIQWLVSTILENYARYQRQGEPPLLSTQWSYVATLVAVVRLFPGDTLELCEQIARRGLGDCLELVADRLRGRRVESARWRIRELWLRPQTQGRQAFIDIFNECDISDLLDNHQIDRDSDYFRAEGLLRVYRRLALLWSVNHEADIANTPTRLRLAGDLPSLTGSLAGMKAVLDEFREIARADGQRVQRLRQFRDSARQIVGRIQPPDAVERVLYRVIQHWEAVLEPRIPREGEKALGYMLGSLLVERGNGVIYAVENASRVVKVLRYPMDSERRDEFNRDARLSCELAERHETSFVRVHALDPIFGYAAMDTLASARDRYSPEDLKTLALENPIESSRIARLAALQLARALHCIHAEGLAHGDLRAKNVFVEESEAGLTFRLGDLHAFEDVSARSMAALITPAFLRTAVPRGVNPQHWLDLVCLTLFLLWLLTGETLEFDANAQARAEAVKSLMRRHKQYKDGMARLVARMLGPTPYASAHKLERAAASLRPKKHGFRLPAFTHKKLAGRVLAKFDVFISYDANDEDLARKLYDELIKRSVVPYLDAKEAPGRWRPEIADAMVQSRAFAVLVGNVYREDGPQGKEVVYAREAASKENLPFKVFMLGANKPRAFARDGDAMVEVGRDPVAMAERIVVSFKHPIESPGNGTLPTRRSSRVRTRNKRQRS